MLDMLVAARWAVSRLGRRSREEFLADEEAQWLMFSQIVLIGEAANRVTREDQTRFADVPWASAIAVRHRIVHGYDSIDWSIVYDLVRGQLPDLIERLEKHVPPEAP